MRSKSESQALPGLEIEAAAEARRKRAQRMKEGRALAERMAGPVRLEPIGEGWGLVNTETGELLEDAPRGEARGERFAAMLLAASEPENHLAGMFQNEKGEAFLGGACLWAPSFRLDGNWLEAMRRRTRKSARAAFRKMIEALPAREVIAIKKGYKHRLTKKLVTLTQPSFPGASSETEIKRINRAFRTFSDSEQGEWKAKTWGAIKGVENALDADGPHAHVHALTLGRFLRSDVMRRQWTRAVWCATVSQYGALAILQSPMPLCFVDVRMIGKGEECVSEDQGLDEVCKYITTPESLTEPDEHGRRVPREVLLELAEIARWPRMFEMLGACRAPKAPKGAQLDTSCISAARHAMDYILNTLDGGVSLEAIEPEEIETDPETARLALLRKKAQEDERKERREEARTPSWRELMDRLTLRDWLTMLCQRALRGAKFRLQWLMEHNPELRVEDMTGRIRAYLVMDEQSAATFAA